MSTILRWLRPFALRLSNAAMSPSIYYVTDNANWAFYWVAYYITEGLKRRGIPAQMIQSVDALKNQIVHFGNRYAYLDGPFREFDRSNRVILTWFHGEPAYANAEIWRLLGRLQEALPYLDRVLVSCRIAHTALLQQGVPEEKLVKIPLGVDLVRFTPSTPASRDRIRAELGIPADAFCVGSFQKDSQGWGSSLEPKLIKGPDIFLAVIEKLVASPVVDRNKLRVLLTAPAREYVKQGLDYLGVPYVHHILDDYYQISQYYQAIDVYLITSRSEGGPKALLESWATGVPVVSTYVGMSADLIRHGENGLLAPIEDVNTLAEHTLTLIQNDGMRSQLVEQARRDVARYDWRIIADRYYDELYAPLLNPSVFRRFRPRNE